MNHFKLFTDFLFVIINIIVNGSLICCWSTKPSIVIVLQTNTAPMYMHFIHYMCWLCTNAMKTSPIDPSISDEFNLSFSKLLTNIEEKNLQKKLQFEYSSKPSLLLPKNRNRNNSSPTSSGNIVSLRFKKETKWIHRHHRQTVLSKKSQLLSVGCILILHCQFILFTFTRVICIGYRFCIHMLEHHLRAWLFWILDQQFAVVLLSLVQSITHAMCACYLLPFSFQPYCFLSKCLIYDHAKKVKMKRERENKKINKHLPYMISVTRNENCIQPFEINQWQ